AVTKIGETFLEGGVPWTASALAKKLGVPDRTVQEILHQLASQEILAVIGEEIDPGYLPARAIDMVTVKIVLDALKGTAGPVEFPAEERADERVDRILSGLDDEMARSAHNLTLRQLALKATADHAEAEGRRDRAQRARTAAG